MKIPPKISHFPPKTQIPKIAINYSMGKKWDFWAQFLHYVGGKKVFFIILKGVGLGLEGEIRGTFCRQGPQVCTFTSSMMFFLPIFLFRSSSSLFLHNLCRRPSDEMPVKLSARNHLTLFLLQESLLLWSIPSWWGRNLVCGLPVSASSLQ